MSLQKWFLIFSMVAGAASAESDCAPRKLPRSETSAALAQAARALMKTDPCRLVSGFTAQTLFDAWNLMVSTDKKGGLKLNTETPAGLPGGDVLGSGGVVHFDFAAVSGERIRAFNLLVDNKELISSAAPPATLEVPVVTYDEHAVFVWTLTTDRQTYRGQFHLVAAGERDIVMQKLAGLDAQSLDSVSKLFYEAAIYDDSDLYSDRDRIFLQLRRMFNL
jgi:hypothetical protein